MKDHTEYIAILREPFSKLRSALKYFGYVRQQRLGTKVDPAEHFLTPTKTGAYHQCAEEFGYEPGADKQTFLAYIDSKFKVIIV